jgi:hypothetical protein
LDISARKNLAVVALKTMTRTNPSIAEVVPLPIASYWPKPHQDFVTIAQSTHAPG